jgi:hypothetical protein
VILLAADKRCGEFFDGIKGINNLFAPPAICSNDQVAGIIGIIIYRAYLKGPGLFRES